MKIDRRKFIGRFSSFGILTALGLLSPEETSCFLDKNQTIGGQEMHADLVIIGGGLGGCAAALAALRNGLQVILTEETDWIGGQLTAQAVPPDEHQWIESHGATASYRELRKRIRDYYRRNYPLVATAKVKADLNPGNGLVSRLCHEPRVALAVLHDLLAPYRSNGQLILLEAYRAVRAYTKGDKIEAVGVQSFQSGREHSLSAPYFIDATELGDLLPLSGAEFITGTESKGQTGELHAPDKADPNNQQAFTMCFAIDHLDGENHTIDKPETFDFWRDFAPKLSPPWPGKLLDFTYTHPRSGQPKTLGFDPSGVMPDGVINLWTYRRLIDPGNFLPGSFAGDIILVNWPQNDYFLGNLVGVSQAEQKKHIADAKQLSLSLLYWLQTEAPRFDGGTGFPGLRLRGDLLGTEDGLAKYPYARESRRIRPLFTILEEHVGKTQREMLTGKSGSKLKAAHFYDSVGVGSYPIDLHPSTRGDNYIDFASLPFQIPLGALIPQRMENLLAASKNIGTTHLTNGCYRLHPVEWGIGEAAGCLASYALQHNQTPHSIRSNSDRMTAFQHFITDQGIEIAWPDV